MDTWKKIIIFAPAALLAIHYFLLVALEKGAVGYLLGNKEDVPQEKVTRYMLFHGMKWVALIVPPFIFFI